MTQELRSLAQATGSFDDTTGAQLVDIGSATVNVDLATVDVEAIVDGIAGATPKTLADIDTKMPVLGQALAAASVPVVLPATQVAELIANKEAVIYTASVVIAVTAVVTGDDQGPESAAQLDDYESLTGLTAANTNAGALYFSVADDTGGFFHVDIYKDEARTTLVGHTGTYNAGGSEAISADNASGVGGAITVVSATAVDVNITAVYSLPFKKTPLSSVSKLVYGAVVTAKAGNGDAILWGGSDAQTASIAAGTEAVLLGRTGVVVDLADVYINGTLTEGVDVVALAVV